ncbi:MAG TPA: hypothetical protein VF400_16840 [Anaeromyxobacteraceae bacterium]
MRRAALLTALALLAGCDLVHQLENRKILVAAVLSSPAVSVGGASQSSLVTAQVFFGERQSVLSAPPTGIDGASVTLAATDGNTTSTYTLQPVGAKGAGWYQATGAVRFTAGTTIFQFKVTYQGAEFSGSVQAPKAATMQGLPASPARRGPVTLTRAGTDDAFYAVVRANLSADFANATCTNAPVNDAGKLVQFVLDDSAWKAPSFVLPVDPCFPGTGTDAFVVSLTTVAKSADVSTNLFLGSAIIAGAADAGGLVVTP